MDPLVERLIARFSALKSVQPFDWTKSDTATFKAGGVPFEVYFKGRRITHAVYGVISGYQATFYKAADKDAPWMYKPTGEGNAMAIFATVTAVVKDFLVKRRPPHVWFVADEATRVRLYNRLLPRMVVPGYVADITGEGLYMLRRTKSVFEP